MADIEVLLQVPTFLGHIVAGADHFVLPHDCFQRGFQK
jgi:hypothetical protein